MSSTTAIAAIHLDGIMHPFKEERLDGVKYVDCALAGTRSRTERGMNRSQARRRPIVNSRRLRGCRSGAIRRLTRAVVDETAHQQEVRGRLGAQVVDPFP